MSNGGSILPPDIREQMENKKEGPPIASQGGVGGRAHENSSTAHQRNVAMGRPDEEDDGAKPAPAKVAEKAKPTTCPNGICNAAVETTWAFCSKCGTDLAAKNLQKMLGIKLDEKDLQDYLFKGYIVRDLKIMGSHTMTTRTSQAKDMQSIDDYIINGAWQKDAEGNERQVSDFMVRQMNAMCLTAMAISKIDGKSIGSDLKERVAYLEERGSAFVDIVAGRVTLFNQALTEYLRKEDSLLGS